MNFVSSVLARWLAVALIALAPLACVQYCHMMHEVAHAVHNHEAGMHNAGHAPLAEMQEMVHAVTDALPLLTLWAILLIVIAMRATFCPNLLQVAHAPLIPPPKQIVLLTLSYSR